MMHFKKRFIRGVIYYGLRIVVYIASGIPMKTGLRISEFLGKLVYYIFKREKKRQLETLRLPFQKRTKLK